MEDLRDPLYRKLYLDGYVFGQNPAFLDCEDIAKSAPRYNNRAFLNGFQTGRKDYEKLNGKLNDGVPRKILTTKILGRFTQSGQLGMPLEAVGYNSHQLKYIKEYYAKGRSNYVPENDFNLYLLLSENGIKI
jgi:hypothetical protein